jgi:hypothetical protein
LIAALFIQLLIQVLDLHVDDAKVRGRALVPLSRVFSFLTPPFAITAVSHNIVE